MIVKVTIPNKLTLFLEIIETLLSIIIMVCAIHLNNYWLGFLSILMASINISINRKE